MQILYDTFRNIAQTTQLAETISDAFSILSALKYFESYDFITEKVVRSGVPFIRGNIK